MEAVSAEMPSERSSALRAILFGGLLAGVLDLTAACMTNYWTSPLQIFQAIASGLLGAASFSGGARTAALGVLLHFFIAFSAAAVYYAASRQLEFLVNQAIVYGTLYGAAVYWFMQLIVLPLSAFKGAERLTAGQILTGLLVHILFVGLPIALVTRRFSK